MLTNRTDRVIADIIDERKDQKPFDDSQNTQGTWIGYILQYASAWALPYKWDPEKYNFRTCMVKVAALAVAAIEWCDEYGENPCEVDVRQARIVADSISRNEPRPA